MTAQTSTESVIPLPEVDEDDYMSAAEEAIKERILHTLTIYPRLSPSMLQVGIGTAIGPKMWHPILEMLISEGVIVKEERRAKTPTKRDQVYVILRLATTE